MVLSVPFHLDSHQLHQLGLACLHLFSIDQLSALNHFLILKNRLWIAVSVQDVGFAEIRADEGSILNFGKTETAAAAAGE